MSLFGIPLPGAIAGLSRADITNNEMVNPGLGYTIPYNGAEEKATIYIYDFGLNNIPEDPMSDVVRQHFEECIAQIMQMKDRGIYSGIEIGDSYGIGSPTSGLQFLCCEFMVCENDKLLDTFLFVTSYGGKFVKLRYTMPHCKHASTSARGFADAVGSLLWPSSDDQQHF